MRPPFGSFAAAAAVERGRDVKRLWRRVYGATRYRLREPRDRRPIVVELPGRYPSVAGRPYPVGWVRAWDWRRSIGAGTWAAGFAAGLTRDILAEREPLVPLGGDVA